MSQPTAKTAHRRSRGSFGSHAPREDGHGRDDHGADVPRGNGQELGSLRAVQLADRPPLPGHDREEGRVDEGEGGSRAGRGISGEHGEEREDAHLGEDEEPGPPVFAAMELDVQGTVEPGIQIIAKTTANSAVARTVMPSARWFAACPMTAT